MLIKLIAVYMGQMLVMENSRPGPKTTALTTAASVKVSKLQHYHYAIHIRQASENYKTVKFKAAKYV